MSKSECRTNALSPHDKWLGTADRVPFGFRHSDFFRHSVFVIRIFNYAWLTAAASNFTRFPLPSNSSGRGSVSTARALRSVNDTGVELPTGDTDKTGTR